MEPAQSVPAEIRSIEVGPSAGVSFVHYEGADTYADYSALSLGYDVRLSSGLAFSAGGRLGLGENLVRDACGEGFLGVGVSPRFQVLRDEAGRSAAWSPLLGLEAGITSARFDDGGPLAPGDVLGGNRRAGYLYAQLVSRPLRFRLSSFQAHAFGLSVGTHLDEPGRFLRVQLDVLQIGWVL